MKGFGPFVVGAVFGFIVGPHIMSWIKKHTSAFNKPGYY